MSVTPATQSTSNVIQMHKVLGKTEQRVQTLLQFLEENPGRQFSYQDLIESTGMPYDALLYVLHALAAVDVVQKSEVPDGPGRPRVTFAWAAPRASGARKVSVR